LMKLVLLLIYIRDYIWLICTNINCCEKFWCRPPIPNFIESWSLVLDLKNVDGRSEKHSFSLINKCHVFLKGMHRNICVRAYVSVLWGSSIISKLFILIYGLDCRFRHWKLWLDWPSGCMSKQPRRRQWPFSVRLLKMVVPTATSTASGNQNNDGT
jgi:hypothetical protein